MPETDDSWLETLLILLRSQSCSRKPGGPRQNHCGLERFSKYYLNTLRVKVLLTSIRYLVVLQSDFFFNMGRISVYHTWILWRTVPQQTWTVWYLDGSGGAFSDAHATTVELLLCLAAKKQGAVWKRHEAIMKIHTSQKPWSYIVILLQKLRRGTFGHNLGKLPLESPSILEPCHKPQPLRDTPTSLSSPSHWTEFRTWVPKYD